MKKKLRSRKRRIRRKKTDSHPSIKDDDSDSEIIKDFESDYIDSKSNIKKVPSNSLTIKEFLKKSNDLDFTK